MALSAVQHNVAASLGPITTGSRDGARAGAQWRVTKDSVAHYFTSSLANPAKMGLTNPNFPIKIVDNWTWRVRLEIIISAFYY